MRPSISAIGDNVNIAARLEGMTKAYRCVLVVSAEILRQAGVDPGDAAAPGPRARPRERSRPRGGDPRKLEQGTHHGFLTKRQ